jgi:hypothetical protein
VIELVTGGGDWADSEKFRPLGGSRSSSESRSALFVVIDFRLNIVRTASSLGVLLCTLRGGPWESDWVR